MVVTPQHCGFPVKMSEMLSNSTVLLTSSVFLSMTFRTSSPAKKAIKKAFEAQIEGKGFTHGRGALHLPHQLGLDARRKR